LYEVNVNNSADNCAFMQNLNYVVHKRDGAVGVSEKRPVLPTHSRCGATRRQEI